jgi:radical SAM enzyme (TIGR01210 family)
MPPSAADALRITDSWIVQQRGRRNAVDPALPYAHMVELERTRDGRVEDVATIFITNKECPFRCLMCDLWRNTTTAPVPDGSVAGQIEWALGLLPRAQHVKLYNAGSFFDKQAVPRADWPQIAKLLSPFRTVTVESHPKLVDRACDEFAQMLQAQLEVAMGLETVDPAVLPRLNKRMTLADFERAADYLIQRRVNVRAFILLRTPFQTERQGVEWAKRSIDYAFSVGVECCVVIPTRSGNGAMDRLHESGLFEPPRVENLEEVLDYGIGLGRGRVFADLWDIERFFACPRCGPLRRDRLHRANLSQRILPPVECQCDD